MILPASSRPAWLLPLLLLSFTPALRAQQTAPRLTFQERLSLIQKNPKSPFGASSWKGFEKDLGRELTPDERRAFESTDEGKWKTFEDDLIRFDLPDEPSLTVEVVDAQEEKPIEVIGGVASNADNRFERAYHLKVGGSLHYGVIFVCEAPWFDDGLCMCGPIVYKKCFLEEGTALEFSLLPSGNIKKVQALGAKHRAMLFEWTHSAIPQSAYVRLGRSLRLKQASPRSLQEWHAEARSQNGEDALLAWLERGDDAKTVAALLGDPTQRDKDGQWIYTREIWQADGAGYRSTLSFKMDPKRGYLGIGPEGGNGWNKLPPKPDTPAWAEQLMQDANDYRTSDAEKARIKKEDFPKITRLFLDHAATDKGNDWDSWIYIACAMTRQGWKDARIPEAVLKRYAEKDLLHHFSTEILAAYETKGRQQLFLDQMDLILALKEKEGKDQAGDEARALLPALDPKDPATQERVRRALQHPNSRVRNFACPSAACLPDTEAFSALKLVLDDENDYTRASAATALAHLVHAEDIPWLEERMKREEEDSTAKDALEKAIEAARSRPTPRAP